MGTDNVLVVWKSEIARLVGWNKEKSLFKVGSSSNPEEWYDVALTRGECSCIGFSFRGQCKHLRLARGFSERKGVSQKMQIEKDGDGVAF